MQPGPARDTAIQAFSKTLARENPEDALVWAGAMTDPRQRSDVQVEIARRWHKSSPGDAETWISANLPPDVRVRILPITP